MLKKFLVTACAYAALTPFAMAITVPVSEDASVNRANPNGNLNNLTTRGGLFSGLDNTGSDYQFFLKFVLPTFDPASPIVSARVRGTYTDDFSAGVDSFHQLYFVSDDSWSETTLTFNTQPSVTSAINGSDFEAYNSTPGDTIEFDVTQIVQQESEGDGVLSLYLATIDGRFEDMEFFASKEFDEDLAFHLEITNESGPVIPIPPAIYSGGAALIGALRIRLTARTFRRARRR